MGDIFDLANLITTVGVDAVKIKPEPGLPEKSSTEILTELFSNFDAADEGINSPENSDGDSPTGDASKSEKSDKHSSKKKKSKKKHKHKEKKHKKKSKNSSGANDQEDTKKKKRHKKKSKRKSEDKSGSDTDVPSAKIRKLNSSEDELSKVSKNADNVNGKRNDDPENDSKSGNNDSFKSHGFKKLDDDGEIVAPKLLGPMKTNNHGKILIKDLKNSKVYSNAVKEIEIKEKERAARMEDGEISDSSDDNRTPTLSPSPDLMDRDICPQKTDLRLKLKEKEKNKQDGKFKSKHNKDYKDGKKKKPRVSSDKDTERRRSRSRQRLETRYGRGMHSDYERRERSRERRNRTRSTDRRSRSDDRNRRRYSRGRSRSRSNERKERIEIDKKKLLEIARRNAINMIMKGTLPLAQQNKVIAAIQAGGKTIDELTDFCKSLSRSEALGELSSISSEDDGSETEKGFHHPFLIKDKPLPIIMNIRDSKQLPTRTFQEKTAKSSNQLRLQFPVSSGQQHRKTESEWIPVPPKPPKPAPTKVFIASTETLRTTPLTATAPIVTSSVMLPNTIPSAIPGSTPTTIQTVLPAMPAAVPTMPVMPAQSAPAEPVSIFMQPPAQPLDIGSIVSQRLAAMRKLKENPNDVQALNDMYKAQNGMKCWAESKQKPGQFTGTTGARVLTPAELQAGCQAWARKDQLLTAQPVSGGMGMALLQKMGWRPGEGLGKNKEGTLVPLQLEVKLDKKGLVSNQDIAEAMKVGKPTKASIPAAKSLEGKHPVSLLGEFCSKRKYGSPSYELCFECGPDHKKTFLFKVKVNGIEYKPAVASPNKKQAKAEAAQICLQSLGLLHTNMQ